MRLGYYGYFLTRGNQKYQYNILPILKNFAKIKPCSFSKIEIEDLDEEVFFKDLGMNRFMLILTKNGEIIKAINSETGDAADIYDKIENNNKLGFASYIKFHDSAFGYAICSTTGGPKNNILTDTINKILSKIQSGPNPILFYSVAMTESSTIQDVKRLSFVGTMAIEAKRDSSLGEMLRQALGLDDDGSIDSFEVCIKPKRGKSLNLQTSHAILDKIEIDGLKKYVVKGKKELEDLLSEFYLVAEGHIGDNIKKDIESSMLAEINRKFASKENFFNDSLTSLWERYTFSQNNNELGELVNYEQEAYWKKQIG